jgi:hypothetical protein
MAKAGLAGKARCLRRPPYIWGVRENLIAFPPEQFFRIIFDYPLRDS